MVEAWDQRMREPTLPDAVLARLVHSTCASSCRENCLRPGEAVPGT